MNALLAIYLGGCLASGALSLGSVYLRSASLWVSLPMLVLSSAAWPVAAFFPAVQWLALKYGWWGMEETLCVVCERRGVARVRGDDMVPPQEWVVTVAQHSDGRSHAHVVCSFACAEVLREHAPLELP